MIYVISMEFLPLYTQLNDGIKAMSGGISGANKWWDFLGVRTCELFLCFAPVVFFASIVLTSLFSLFYIIREFHRFLHRGWTQVIDCVNTSKRGLKRDDDL